MQIHRAGRIIVNPWKIIENGYIAVVDNTIVDVGSYSSKKIADIYLSSPIITSNTQSEKVIDHGDGILMPALINAHTHFELSALKGKIPFDKGFNNWVKELITQRENLGVDILIKEAQKAIKDSVESGTLIAGEISTLGITKDIFKNSDIYGVWFQEYLGELTNEIQTSSISGLNISTSNSSTPNSSSPNRFEEKIKSEEQNKRKFISTAGHAPHTTSTDLLKLLKNKAERTKLPFSIHLAESDDETEFITTKKGSWAEFLKQRGIDFSKWNLPSRSPVQYLNDLGVLDNLTLIVHLINIDIKDIEIIKKTGAKPVICPRSNFNLHKKIPDIPLFLKYGLKPALGTDSLASTETLNMFDEMAFAASKFPQINPSDILAMATINSASALGGYVEKNAGTIEKGKKDYFIYIPLNISSSNSNAGISNSNISDIIMKIIEYKRSVK